MDLRESELKDYISIDVASSASGETILQHVKKLLPDYKWRSGINDTAGSYVSGINPEQVRIKFWLEEKPLEVGISFTTYDDISLHRESNKKAVLSRIIQALAPSLGTILKIHI